MAITGDASFTFKTAVLTPPKYEAKVLRIRREDNEEATHLERELTKEGLKGWYPSVAIGDMLILTRVKPTAGPAVSVILTWGSPQPIPKGTE